MGGLPLIGWLVVWVSSLWGCEVPPLRGEGVWTHDEGRLPWRYLLLKVRVPGRGVENSWVGVDFSGERGA